MQFAPFMMQQGLVTDWALRVVANGGAMPSQTSIIAMENLRVGCIADGYTNKIDGLCVFVPDSLIAASTPLFYHLGSLMWTNTDFVGGDLNINGLKGDGVSKALDTGIKAKDSLNPANPPRGLTVIVTESASNATCTAMGQQDADDTITFVLNISSAGNTGWFPAQLSASLFSSISDFGRVGYISGNLTTNSVTNITTYVASPLEAHKVLTNRQTAGNLNWVETASDATISVFANKHGTTNNSWSPQRLSAAAVTKGFTESESSAFWSRLKTCRETLGGGTGDPVHDWDRKIVATGASHISTATSNAMRTALASMDTASILYSNLAVNFLVPDSLTAARTPIIWQAGAEIWTNTAFAASNLTVDGLRGDGTSKYLGTAFNPSTAVGVRGFTHSSAGMSMIVVSNNATGKYVAGVGSGAANSHFAILNENGVNQFYAWRFDSVNSNFLLASGLTNGFLSGSRTASNAIALYRARSDTTFARLTNGTGTMGGSAVAAPLAAFALNGNGTVSAFTPQQISFLAVHAGLTEAQTSNMFVIAQAFRTAVGGGAP